MNSGKPKLWTKEYIIIALINFLIALNFYLLMIIVADYAMKKFNSPPGEAGFAASIFIIGALFTRIFTGKWIARIGYKKMLGWGLSGCLLMTLAYFPIDSVTLLFVVRFFHGAVFGFASTATATIVSDIVPVERSGEGIGYYSLSQTLATAIGPFIGMFLSRHGSYSMIFTACTIVAVLSLVMAPFLSLRKIELTEEQVNGMREFKLDSYVETGVIPIALICLLVYLCYSSIVSFIAVYAKEINMVNAAGFFFIVYAAVVLISRPVAGRLFDLKGENSVMYPAFLIFAAGMLLFSRSCHGASMLLSAVLVGLGFGAIQSSTQTIAVKVTPRHRMGLANSTYFMFSDIGMGVGPLLAGLIIPFTGYRGMYMVAAVIALSCLFFYYLLHGRTALKKRRS